MEIIGFALTLFIGLLIGMFGGGGSILSVPVLVYLFAIPTTLSTTYSLALVSITSLIAAIPNVINKKLSFSRIVMFGIPSMIALYTVRAFLLPVIPNEFEILHTVVHKNNLMMVFFSVLMLLSGLYMVLNKKSNPDVENRTYSFGALIMAGLLEGSITGMVGAGGGFIIVPVLMIFGKLNLKQAVGNSLLIIGIKSLIGFLGSQDLLDLDIYYLVKMIIISLVGMFFGIYLSTKVDSKQLKPLFGYFVVAMGIFILIKEVILFN
ncbi:sulfite exporter TauE/SafE family protein [Chryseobacterium sp.]|uniref:sulfite exporter TauE/SafE family protein n=1 Tax=Chryseobacterium sp. TaxID=1871047 RepID=UPI00388F303A